MSRLPSGEDYGPDSLGSAFMGPFRQSRWDWSRRGADWTVGQARSL